MSQGKAHTAGNHRDIEICRIRNQASMPAFNRLVQFSG